VGTTEGMRSGNNPAVARWSLTPPVSKSNRGRGVDEASSYCRGREDSRAAHRFGSSRAPEDG
jgi:hypothetical protein